MRALMMDSRLEAIAGKPAGMLVGSGSVALSGFTQFGDRSVYFVYDVLGSASVGSVVARLGSGAATGYLPVITDNGFGNYHWQTRPMGVGATDVGPAGSGTIGRHVGMISRYGSSSVRVAILGGTDANGSETTPNTGYEAAPPLALNTIPGVATGIIAVAYPAVHTAYQRQAIMRKLLSMSGA